MTTAKDDVDALLRKKRDDQAKREAEIRDQQQRNAAAEHAALTLKNMALGQWPDKLHTLKQIFADYSTRSGEIGLTIAEMGSPPHARMPFHHFIFENQLQALKTTLIFAPTDRNDFVFFVEHKDQRDKDLGKGTPQSVDFDVVRLRGIFKAVVEQVLFWDGRQLLHTTF